MKKKQLLSMKLAEFLSNKKGLSIVELLIAITVFGMVAAAIIILILNVYSNIQQNKEESLAIFLAEEGLEAARAVRDNDWDVLTIGEHGLIISGNNWVFQGTEEDISDRLRQGERKIIVQDIDSDPDKRKVTSQITWEISETQSRNVSLITYLTNWQKEGGGQADRLLVDSSKAELTGDKKNLRKIYLNSSQGTLTIDKMIFVWDNENKIEQVRIDNTFVWMGKQPSGTELDIENFEIEEGEEVEIDKVKFDGIMSGTTFSITFIMIDESIKTVSDIVPK